MIRLWIKSIVYKYLLTTSAAKDPDASHAYEKAEFQDESSDLKTSEKRELINDKG